MWIAERLLSSSSSLIHFSRLHLQTSDVRRQIKSNQIYLLKTSHLRVAIDKTVDEQGRQGSKEHLQWP